MLLLENSTMALSRFILYSSSRSEEEEQILLSVNAKSLTEAVLKAIKPVARSLVIFGIKIPIYLNCMAIALLVRVFLDSRRQRNGRA